MFLFSPIYEQALIFEHIYIKYDVCNVFQIDVLIHSNHEENRVSVFVCSCVWCASACVAAADTDTAAATKHCTGINTICKNVEMHILILLTICTHTYTCTCSFTCMLSYSFSLYFSVFFNRSLKDTYIITYARTHDKHACTHICTQLLHLKCCNTIQCVCNISTVRHL